MTVSLGWRACATILPVTLALAASAPVTSFSSSLCTASTSAKVTLAPTLPARRSTLMVSPGATRYCLPPLRMTAYMKPPDAIRKPPLYGRRNAGVKRGRGSCVPQSSRRPACFARCRIAAASPYNDDSTHLGGCGPPLLPLLREWRNLTLAAPRPDRDAAPPASPPAPVLLQTVQRASFRLLLPQARYSALGDARFSRPRSPLTPGRICRPIASRTKHPSQNLKRRPIIPRFLLLGLAGRQARGCALSYTSINCRTEAWVYFCVVESELWPRSSWMARRSAPSASRCVAKAWRSECGCRSQLMFTRPAYFLTMRPTERVPSRRPAKLRKTASGSARVPALRSSSVRTGQ